MNLLAAINHPSIPRVYEFGVENTASGGKAAFLVTELLSDKQYVGLDSMVGYLSPAEVTSTIQKIGEAVDYMAEKGVFHQDLKPENIKIPRKNMPLAEEQVAPLKIYDFGLANLEGFSGDPEYMAPEVVESMGKQRDLRSEVYTLGVIAYEAMVGGLPPVAVHKESEKQFDAVALEYLQDYVRSSRSGVAAKELHTVIKKCMAKNPDDRYQTAAEFSAALNAVTANQQEVRTTSVRI